MWPPTPSKFNRIAIGLERLRAQPGSWPAGWGRRSRAAAQPDESHESTWISIAAEARAGRERGSRVALTERLDRPKSAGALFLKSCFDSGPKLL